jgi:hypothetical protein
MASLFKQLCAMIFASPLLIVSAQQPAAAWTRTGHAAIGFVTEAKLKTDNWVVWKKLAALLGAANLYDEDIAGWADDMRANYPDVAHSVRIPVLGAIPAASDPACFPSQPNVMCADKAIAYYSAILKNEANAPAQRLEALKFILHLVGDLHQPLHGAEPGGYNEVLIAGGVLAPTNQNGTWVYPTIHGVWDYSIVKRHGKTAIGLGQELWTNTVNPPVGFTPRDWAVESRNLAKQHLFLDPANPSANDANKVTICGGRTGTACPSNPETLPADYETRQYALAVYRMLQAGLRLAELLVNLLTP